MSLFRAPHSICSIFAGESSLAAVLNLLIGLTGAFLLSSFARRKDLIQETAKVGLGLGSFFGVFVAVFMIRLKAKSCFPVNPF